MIFISPLLAGYYAEPYLLISRHLTLTPPLTALVPVLYIFGIFLRRVNGVQKFQDKSLSHDMQFAEYKKRAATFPQHM